MWRDHTWALVRQCDMISPEDSQTANLLTNHRLATSVADAGWSTFLSILAFKAACAGKWVVAVPSATPSLHHDHNAGKNLHWLGERLREVPALAGTLNREAAGL
jgi:hypothetical protein